MWIINAFLTWILWRQADGLLSLEPLGARIWGWLCVAFSAANAAVVATKISEML